MTRRTLVGTLAAVALALAVPLPAAAAANLETRIEAAKASLTTADEVMVAFSLTNTGDRSARVLRWETPLLGVDDDLFLVERNGEPVAYLGRMFKRGAPQPADYIVVQPGQTLGAKVPLSSLYDFSRPGEYVVQFRGQAAASKGPSRIEPAASNVVALWVEGDDLSAFVPAPAGDAEGQPAPAFVTPRFRNCSTSRQNSTRSGLSTAQTIAGNSLGYLNAGTRGARYTTWFGTYTSSRYSTVRSHFVNIDNAIRTKAITFDCGCTESAYAYVYPNRPYEIFLCNAFWSAPNSGTDSKSGTIVHELSHFNVVASTNDWAYGQSACRSLARSSPSRAVDNADSHEYFAENTPFQN
jgi:peptidyl-Lys metalloendopeptidase